MEHFVLEYVEGFDHEHDLEIPHERGLTVEQKCITIEWIGMVVLLKRYHREF